MLQMPHFWDLLSMDRIMTFMIPIVIIVFVVVLTKLYRTDSRMIGERMTDAPPFVIPKRACGHLKPHGTEIRTVCLPNRCPNCGALISQVDIQWTGPLEAECGYCGSSVKAQFERV